MEDLSRQPGAITNEQKAFKAELEMLLPNSQEAESVDTETRVQQLDAESIDRELLALRPYSEIDDRGLTRLIFQYNEVTFSFAGRQEIPRFTTLERSKPQRLGHQRWDAPEAFEDDLELDERRQYVEYNDYLSVLQERNAAQPEHLLAETSPLGIYLLLSKLQSENTNWSTQAQAVAEGHYDDITLQMIDMVTAVNALYESEHPEAAHQPPVGEALVVQALMGNAEMRAVVQGAVDRQNLLEEQALAKEKLDMQSLLEQYKDLPAYRPEDLVVVHATNYEPGSTGNGYSVQTTHDASGFPRATIHTALNHKVDVATMAGEWDSKDFVLIAGLQDVLAADGSPNSINGADTWWSRNPGEKMDFPAGTLVAPGGDQEDLLIEQGGRTSYKSENITAEDLQRADMIFGGGTGNWLTELLKDEGGNLIDIAAEDAQRIIANGLRDLAVRREITVVRGKEYLEQDDDKYMSSEVSRRLLKMAAEQDLIITGHLHADSDESYSERVASMGERRAGTYVDPKVRRVAYASGFMGTGGRARLNYIAKQLIWMDDEEGD